jgi:hypothetical protein
MACYFGRLKVMIESQVGQGWMRASVQVTGTGGGLDQRRPMERVLLRLPHPDGKPALRCWGENDDQKYLYDRETETVTIEPWTGKAEVVLEF